MSPASSLSPESLAASRVLLTEPWKPIVIARVNESVVRMALVHGEFPWHHHAEDEMFMGYEGTFVLETRRGNVTLGPGEFFVVPAGLEHRPVAREPAVLLLFEPAETKQYGEPDPR